MSTFGGSLPNWRLGEEGRKRRGENKFKIYQSVQNIYELTKIIKKVYLTCIATTTIQVV